MRLWHLPLTQPAPVPPDGMALLAHPVREGEVESARLYLALPHDEDQPAARHLLAQWASLFAQLAALQDRHKRLQKLVITDDLTGVYNGRYFRHFLGSILERAKERRFPVALLLFDIDNFKQYNDQYGHGVGDEILKQTAALMRRCCRDHDLVARISGDEFAVVFWEKEGPRQPRQPSSVPPARRPQTPLQILTRFQKLLKSQQFTGLGAGGQGVLTISGGMAVFPYDATDMESLITAADRELMFRAKRAGKNSIFLVGSEERLSGQE
jgi:two-component system cell cycle response regulator